MTRFVKQLVRDCLVLIALVVFLCVAIDGLRAWAKRADANFQRQFEEKMIAANSEMDLIARAKVAFPTVQNLDFGIGYCQKALEYLNAALALSHQEDKAKVEKLIQKVTRDQSDFIVRKQQLIATK